MKQKVNKKNDLTRFCYPKKKFCRFLTRKNLILTSLTSVVVAVPCLTVVPMIVNENQNKTILFDKTFNSASSAIDYFVKNNVFYESERESEQTVWTLYGDDNNKKVFSSPSEMKDYLFEKYLHENKYTTSMDIMGSQDLATGVLEISDEMFGSRIVKTDQVPGFKTVYEGRNDAILDDEISAKESFFAPIEAYYFNNFFFNSKEDLSTYLLNEYLPLNKDTNFNTIILQAPNGNLSVPIRIDEADATNAIKYINGFITDNVKTVLEYTGDDGDPIIIDEENKSEKVDQINIRNFQYQHVYSNEGQARYILDNNIADNSNLMGPYFYNGVLDTTAFTNKNLWKRQHGVKKNVYEENIVDTVIGTFFTLVTGDDNQSNIVNSDLLDNLKFTLFKTLLKTSEGIPLDEWYMDRLEKYDPVFKNEIEKKTRDLMNGKKFNTFNKVPVLYSTIMSSLISRNADQQIIDDTIFYFSSVADFMQDAMEMNVLDDSLLINKNGKKLYLKDLFGIGNSEFDLNTSTSHFSNEIKQNFPITIAAMAMYVDAVYNVSMMGGLVPFDANDFSFLFDFGYLKEKDWIDNKQRFENIYYTFSSLSYEELVSKYVLTSTMPEVVALRELEPQEQLTEFEKILTRYSKVKLADLLKITGSKNTRFYQFAATALDAEITRFNEHDRNINKIEKDGYLSLLDYPVEFVEMVTANPEMEAYQAYLAVFMDKLNKYHLFDRKNIYFDKEAFAKNVSRLTYGSFFTPTMVAYTFNQMYNMLTDLGGGITPITKMNVFVAMMKRSLGFGDIMGDIPPNVWAELNLTNKEYKKWLLEDLDARSLMMQGNSTFSKVADIVDFVLDKVSPVLGILFFVTEIGFLFNDLFKQEIITDYYTYTLPDGTEFIWDGGRTVTQFFGFDVKETVSIDSMHLVDPVQITMPQLEEFYYFNQVKYYDSKKMKLDQISYYLKSDTFISNGKFSRKYTFDKFSSENILLFDSTEEVNKHVFNELGLKQNEPGGPFDLTNFNKDSKYLSSLDYSFSNGITTGHENTFAVIAENIVDNIRPTYVVKKAKKLGDGSFVLPGLVWTRNGIVDNTDKSRDYHVNNDANLMKDNPKPSNDLINPNDFLIPDTEEAKKFARKNLFAIFSSSFSVNEKDVLINELFFNNHFSSIQEQKVVKIIDLTLDPSSTRHFIDRNKAENYLLKNVNFKKEIRYEKVYTYTDGFVKHTFTYPELVKAINEGFFKK